MDPGLDPGTSLRNWELQLSGPPPLSDLSLPGRKAERRAANRALSSLLCHGMILSCVMLMIVINKIFICEKKINNDSYTAWPRLKKKPIIATATRHVMIHKKLLLLLFIDGRTVEYNKKLTDISYCKPACSLGTYASSQNIHEPSGWMQEAFLNTQFYIHQP